MVRPACCRRIAGEPAASVFKPAGIPFRDLPTVTMRLDEYEAIRLADLEGLYQEDAADRMGISRPTFGRILETAHRKIAEILVLGKALKVEGGPVHVERNSRRRYGSCAGARPVPPDGVVTCPYCRRRRCPVGDEGLVKTRSRPKSILAGQRKRRGRHRNLSR